MASGAKPTQNASAATSEIIYNLFFKNVKTRAEFKKKISKTLRSLNSALEDEELDDILNSLDMKDQPPFAASYTEEGVSEQLHVNDTLVRADIYDILHHFYSKLYDEADKNIG